MNEKSETATDGPTRLRRGKLNPAHGRAGEELENAKAEIAKLRALVEEAYTEGWHDGHDTATENGPSNVRRDCWERSVVHAALDTSPPE